jgi:hypothetical protein
MDDKNTFRDRFNDKEDWEVYKFVCAFIADVSKDKDEKYFDYDPLEIYADGVLESLDTLTDREQDWIWRRYYLGLTYKEVGQIEGHNFSVERARQVIAKAKRRFRHPSRIKRCFVSTYEGRIESLESTLVEADKKYNELLDAYQELKNRPLYDVTKDVPNSDKYIDITVEEMDLSVRSYNCLKIASINNMRQLLEIDCEKFPKLKNFGRKSQEEVLYKMRGYGFTAWADKMIGGGE